MSQITEQTFFDGTNMPVYGTVMVIERGEYGQPTKFKNILPSPSPTPRLKHEKEDRDLSIAFLLTIVILISLVIWLKKWSSEK